MILSSMITGTGTFVPERFVTNTEMSTWIDTSDEWISSRTGIKSRYIVDKVGETTTVDMCKKASEVALNNAKIKATDLDLVIVGTVTPDYHLPSASCMLQDQIGATNAAAFDVQAACASSIYGLCIGSQFLSTGMYKKILVLGADVLSSIVNWDDRNTCVLFGDAAAAAVLEKSPNPQKGFLDFQLHSDGSHWQDIWIPHGGSKHPVNEDTLTNKSDRVVMNGQETFKFAVRALTAAAKKILADNKINVEQVDHVVSHQANLRIIESVANRLNVPLNKFIINIDRYANTSSASLLTTFDEGRTTNRFKENDLILMLAIGSGFAWGASLYRY